MSFLIDSIDDDFLPYPDTIHWDQGKLTPEAASTMEKIQYYAINTIALLVKSIFVPSAILYLMLQGLVNRLVACYNPPPLLPAEPPPQQIDLGSVLPHRVGFAHSLYQSSLLGTPYSATCKPGTTEP